MNPWQEMKRALDEMEAADLRRRPMTLESACGPYVAIGGRRVLCLCSNDYLGLANDPAVKAAAIEAIGRWGVGAGASRLVSGTSRLHVELERRLAAFKGAEAAVLANTGYVANHLAITALAGAGDLILGDKLNHASIVDAAMFSGARYRTYPHGSLERLQGLLVRHRGKHRRCLIVTDSLFSMDGDVAPLREMAELKKRFDAQLLIDEAHATGVLGNGGKGAAELLGVEEDIDVTVGTLSKAVGALGGFIAGPEVLIDTIRNAGRAYVFTTALPPAICAAAIAALEIIRNEPQRRQRLLRMAENLRQRLNRAGLDTGESVSQIIPILIGRAGDAVRASQGLFEQGFFVPAIRPPTVPRGTSRLRVSLSAVHDQNDLDRFAKAVSPLLPGEGRPQADRPGV